MKSETEIKAKIEYNKKQIGHFKGCSEGTDGYYCLKMAESIVKVLEWVLKS